MFRSTTFFTLVVFAFAGLPVCAAPPATSPTANDIADKALPTVLLIGDSISGGYTKAVIQLMEGKANVSRIPGNGEYTGTGLKKIDEWLGDQKWDVIHFNWGLWDMYGWQYAKEDRSPKAYEERLEKLVTRLDMTGAKLIWATTTPICPNAEVTMLNRFKTELKITPEVEKQYLDAANRVMQKHKIQINDLHALVLPELETLSPAPDNVHFTGAGYEKMAKQVAEFITGAIQPNAPDDNAAQEPKKIPSGREQSEENQKHLFILSGQSNMRRELVDAFKDFVERAYGKENVIIASYNRNSQPIRMWYMKWHLPEGEEMTEKLRQAFEVHPNGTCYVTLMKSVEKQTRGVVFDTVTFAWMQGEADAGSGWSEVYAESFNGVMDQLRADLKHEHINFVIGRINDFYLKEKRIREGAEIREIQVKLAESSPRGAWVNTDDLNTGINPWGVNEVDGGHMTVEGYPILGQRFAEAAVKLLGKNNP